MEKFSALITGASRGIGFAIAKRIAPETSQLLISSHHQQHIVQAKHLLEKITSAQIHTASCNHSKTKVAAKKLGNWAKKHLKKLDVLVLNAGYYVEGSLEKIASTDFEENLRVNFLINHYLVQELLPLIKKSDLKRIVIVGSTAAYEPYSAVPTYGVAKWALRGYAINLRRELMKDKVGVTFISPGGTLTDMWAGEKLPPNRLLEPDDIAKLVSALITLSPQAVVEELICRPILGDMHD